VLHRYALSAPKKGFTPNERHEHAFIRHAVSRDGGLSWEDLGPAITPQPPGTWPDHVVWTSSVKLRRDENGEKEFLMFITGRSVADGETQRIGLTRSRDGHHFSVPEVILNPTETPGYDITDGDGIIMAWRDPYLIQDPADGRWHMLFSAKSKDSCGVIRPTADTWVASTMSRPPEPIASCPRCARCQSLAEPSTASYWHMGDTTIRLGRVRPRSEIGENRRLIMSPRSA